MPPQYMMVRNSAKAGSQEMSERDYSQYQHTSILANSKQGLHMVLS
jgi:hypothetical protein